MQLACALAAVCATAGQAGADPGLGDPSPPKDCSLLQDPDRSPSVWRHLRWSVASGSRDRQRLLSTSLGWDVWTREVLCRREVLFESELVYSRVAVAFRLDYEYDVDEPDRSSIRPALEFSTGVTDWGWIAFAASAGPKFDHRGVAAGGAVSLIYIGIDMGIRLDQGIDYDDHTLSVFLGLTDLHLFLPSLFSDYAR